MLRFLLRRLLFLPLALVLVNFAGFAFAHITYQFQQSTTIFGSGQEGITPVWPAYAAYTRGLLHGDFGRMPIGVNQPVAASAAKASLASLGLLGIAFALSLVLGIALGLAAVQVDPPRKLPWLTCVSTIGLAMPGFYLGALFVGGLLLLSFKRGGDSVLPVAGFGWDAHLLLPVLALAVRPTMQVAQVSANLLTGELSKRYIVAARSFGHTWSAIRWDKALRNVLAPLLMVIASSFRMMIAELVLVEWLFSWPGLGRLLVQTLVPPSLSSLGGLVDTSVFFLYPPLVAALLMIFTLLFLLADTAAMALARSADPRLSNVDEEPIHD